MTEVTGERLSELTTLPSALVATDVIYVIRSGVSYKAPQTLIAIPASQISDASTIGKAILTAASAAAARGELGLGALALLSALNATSQLGDGIVTADKLANLSEGEILIGNASSRPEAQNLKTAYEANADTNAFTDAEKTTVGYLTISGMVDLDQAVLDITNLQTEQAEKITGPGSATDNAIVRFNGTTGKGAQNSAVTIDDSGNVAGVAALNSSGLFTQIISGSSAFHKMQRTGSATGTVHLGVAGNRDAANTLDQFRVYNGALTNYLNVTYTDSTGWSFDTSDNSAIKFEEDINLNSNDIDNGGVGNFAGTGAGASVVLSGSTTNEGGQVDFEPGSGGSKTLAIDSYNNTTYDALRIFNKTDGLVLLEIEQSGVIRVNTSYLDLNDNDIDNAASLTMTHATASVIASDTTAKELAITAGTAASDSYGSFIRMFGNTRSGAEGYMLIGAGDAAAGYIDIQTNGTTKISVNKTGSIDFNEGIDLNDNDLENAGQVTAQAFHSSAFNLADDTATTIDIGSVRSGIFMLTVDTNTSGDQAYFMGSFWAGTSNNGFTYNTQAEVVNVSTSVLTGTTGLDDWVTISVPASSTEIYIENRLGETLTFRVTIIS